MQFGMIGLGRMGGNMVRPPPRIVIADAGPAEVLPCLQFAGHELRGCRAAQLAADIGAADVIWYCEDGNQCRAPADGVPRHQRGQGPRLRGEPSQGSSRYTAGGGAMRI